MRFLRGQAAIALSLAIPMMVGAACIGADMWALYLSSVRLQQAADAAVLSAAAYLPANPALAQSVARSKAQMNGIRESEIVYDRPAADGRSITMVVERNVPYRFARLFGLSQSLVTVKAVAITHSSRSAAGLLPIGIQYDARCAAYRSIVWITSIDARGNIDAQVLDSFATDHPTHEQTGRHAPTSVLERKIDI